MLPTILFLLAAAFGFFLFTRRRSTTVPAPSPSPVPASPPTPAPGSPAPGVPPLPTPPSLQLHSPTGGSHPWPVAVRYSLFDQQSDPASITVRFSTDGGATFLPAREAATGSDGITNLATAPGGAAHVFSWDAAHDLPATGAGAVILELIPSDSLAGMVVSSAPFAVAPPAPAPAPAPTPGGPAPGPATPAPAPRPPEVRAFEPLGATGALMAVPFIVSSPDNLHVAVRVEFNFNGGAFQAASPGPGCDDLARLPASKHSLDYAFVWNAAADLGSSVRGHAALRFTVDDGQSVAAHTTGAFEVDTAPPPPLPLNTDRPATPLQIEIVDGDAQIGIAGLCFPRPLRVRVRDRQQQPLAGAGIGFTVVGPGAAAATFERTPIWGTTTAGDGIAATRIRADAMHAGPLLVRATVAGMPGVATQFALDVRAPQIVANPNNPAGPLEYGNVYEFEFLLEGDLDLNTPDFLVDEFAPVLLRFEASGAEISQDEVRLSRSTISSTGAPGARLYLTPSAYTGNVQLRVTAPALPAAAPLALALPIVTIPSTDRLTGVRPRRTALVDLRVELVSGLDPATMSPPRGYPGATLAIPLQVRLIDGAGRLYDQRVTSNAYGCVPPATAPLEINWFAVNGVLNTTPSRGTLANLVAEVQMPVFFTPTHDGPWRVVATVSGPVRDPLAGTFIWTDSSGHTYCERENALQVHLGRTFLIQPPRLCGFENTRTTPASAVTELKPGDLVRLVVDDLSPMAAGSVPEELEVSTMLRDGSAPPAYQGLAAPLRQRVALSPAGARRLATDPILLMAGEPRISTAAPVRHLLLDGGWLQARAPGVNFCAPVRGGVPRRRSIHGAPSAQETSSASTPFAGFDASVNLAAGEMLRFATDLTFQTRPDTFLCSRAYRTHLDDDESVLGPGWHFNHLPRLARIAGGVRLLTSDGKLHDFLQGRTPRGLFHTLAENLVIDSDHSAFELLGPHRDEAHFHADGRLRFLRDRCGNVTRFVYNERAQLIEIVDPLNRATQLAYYLETDPVPPETVGRLKSITGPDGRVVDYEYYAAAGPEGRPGWLKTVLRPAAATLRGGQVDAGYRRQESYRYHVSADAALDGALREVLDSEDHVLVTVGYDAQRRVESQRYGGGELRVAFPAFSTTVVHDRDGNRVTWRFRASPDADAASPLELIEHANRNLRPGQGDVITTYEHNRDGLLTACHWPDGTHVMCVHDDAAQSVRSRGNLLMLQRVARDGTLRTHTWRYTSRYNFVTSHVPPAGHATPGLARRYEIVYVYDHQTGAGNHGNVVRITRPRVLNAAMIRNATNRDELRWIHENPTVRCAYNSFGLPVRYEDECGVVTTFAYYPESQPAGGPGVAASAAGGGFLARVEQDGATTPARDLHLPQVPLTPLATQLAYDDRGDVRRIVDAQGNEHNFVFSPLRQIVSMELYATAPATALRRAAPWREQFQYRPDGLLAWRERLQPGATPLAGGDVLRCILEHDREGRLREAQADLGQGLVMRERWERTTEGFLETQRLPGALAGISPEETISLSTDERGLPVYLRAPTSTGQAAETGFEITPSGRFAAVVPPAGRSRADVVRDRFGDPEGAVLPSDIEVMLVSDAAGRVVANVTRGPASTAGGPRPVWRFSERRLDEEGRGRRVHEGLLASEGAATNPITAAFEGLVRGLTPPWPPIDRTPIEDLGVWGRGDGRASRDVLLDTRGEVTRILSDDNHLTWLRRDARGRILACGDGDDTRLTPRYLPTGELTELVQEARSTAPFDNRILTLRHRLDRDSAGNLFRLIDAQGRARAVEVDATNHVITLTDAMGPATSDRYNSHAINAPGNRTRVFLDGANRVNRVETDLTIDGWGGSAPEPNQYNPHARAGFTFEGDASGRVVGFIDQAGHHYAWRHDRGGRLSSVVYPATPAAPNGAVWSYTYDGSNRVETITDPNGTRTRVIYGPGNRIDGLRVEQYGGGSTGPEGYDFTYENERLATATEWRRPTVPLPPPAPQPLPPSFLRVACREPDGEVIREEQAGFVITAQFDASGRRALLYPNAGRTLVYFNDEKKLVRRMDYANALFARFDYLGDELMASRQNGPLGLKYEYTEAGDLEKLTISGLASGDDIVFELDHDRAARFARWTRTHGPVSESRDWLRDSLGRIIREIATYPSGHPLRERTTRRYFDGDSTLREMQVNDVDAAGTALPARHRYYDRAEAGRIVRRDQTPLQYDANGNLRFDGRWRFRYDFMSRLASVEDTASQETTRHFHDGIGRRYLTLHPNGEEETYLYDGWQLIEVRVNGEPRERYVWAPGYDDLLIAEINDVRYHAVQRPDGSVDAIVDAAGNIVETYDYTLTGERILLDAQRRPSAGVPRQRIGFHGKVHDARTGLVDFRHRVLHAELGIFLTPDPSGLAPTGNAYIFAHHDPLSVTDMSGMEDTTADCVGAFLFSLGATVLIGVLVISGIGLVAGLAFGAAAAAKVLVAGGLAYLVGATTYHALGRMDHGQGLGPSTLGGFLDATGLSLLGAGAFNIDFATGRPLALTAKERSSALGTFAGSLLLFGAAKPILNRALLGGVRMRGRLARTLDASSGRGGMVLQARRQPGEGDRIFNDTHLGQQVVETPGSRVPGRPRDLEEMMDAFQLMLQSQPPRRPDLPFRESALVRYNTYDGAGSPRGSPFVVQTPYGAGETRGIDNAVMDRVWSFWSPRSLQRSPRLLLESYGHTHPPGALASLESMPEHGFSGVDIYNYDLGRHGWWATKGDMMGMELAVMHGPFAGRIARGFSPYVIRLSQNGAIESFTYLQFQPVQPRPTLADIFSNLSRGLPFPFPRTWQAGGHALPW